MATNEEIQSLPSMPPRRPIGWFVEGPSLPAFGTETARRVITKPRAAGEEERRLSDALREDLAAAAKAAPSSDLDERIDAISSDGLRLLLAAFSQVEEWEDRTIDEIEDLVRLTNHYVDYEDGDDDGHNLAVLEAIEHRVDDIKRRAQRFLALGGRADSAEQQRLRGTITSDEANAAAAAPPMSEEEEERPAVDMEAVKDWLARDEPFRSFVCGFLANLPEGSPLKWTDLVNWLVGILGGAVSADSVEEIYMRKMERCGLVAPCYTWTVRGRGDLKGYVLSPSIRSMAAALSFPTTPVSISLIKATRKGQVVQVSLTSAATADASALFNVDAGYLKFDRSPATSANPMQNLVVLHIGRWKGLSTETVKIVDSTAFFDCLRRLRKLRYIGLQGVSGVKELPDAVAAPPDLRAIDLQACEDLERLTCLEEEEGGAAVGSSAGKVLGKLERLDVWGCHLLKRMPGGVGELEELQVLKGFVMGYDKGVCDLGRLTKLRKLSLDFGGTVAVEEAELSCLKNLVHLSTVTASWANFTTKKQIGAPATTLALGWLPECLKKLDLRCFPLEEAPSGLVSGKLKNLERLYFRGGALQDLQPVAKDGPFEQLRVLRLRHLGDFRSLTLSFLEETFPSLYHLDIHECPLTAHQFFHPSFTGLLIVLVNFLIYPENCTIKRSHFVRNIIASSGRHYQQAEDFADGGIYRLARMGLVAEVRRKGTSKVRGYKLTLYPNYIRPMAVRLGDELGHLFFRSTGTPPEENQALILSLSARMRREPFCVFNMNSRYLEPDEVAKWRSPVQLQLGKWPGYAGPHPDIRAVSPSTFFSGLAPLRNLRCLGLQGVSGITEIPEAISGLQSLNILDVRGCPDLATIHQRGVAACRNLIHLDVSRCDSLERMPLDFSSLASSLEVMLGLLMKDSGDFLLRYFNNQNLRKLSLLFCNTHGFAKQEREFSSAHLRAVSISWAGASFPSQCSSLSLDWLPTGIEKLELRNFPKAEKPPGLVPSRFPKLKRLYFAGGSLCSLKDAAAREDGDAVWEQVEALRLRGLKDLEVDWVDLQRWFPRLVSAEVVGCPKVTSFPCGGDGIWIDPMLTVEHGQTSSEQASSEQG